MNLGTPDMVQDLLSARTGDGTPPTFVQATPYSLYRQLENRSYPAHTFSPAEVLDPTFYTHNPFTAPEMTRIIQEHGGGGIVVSLSECLERYQEVRELLEVAAIALPDDPSELREWSLVMAFTGVLNALERGLIDHSEIIVHASGSFAASDYTPLAASNMATVHDQGEFEQAIVSTLDRTTTHAVQEPAAQKSAGQEPLSQLSLCTFDGTPLPEKLMWSTIETAIERYGYVVLRNVPETFAPVQFSSKLGPFVPQYTGVLVGDVMPEPGMDADYHAGNTRPLHPHSEGYDFAGLPPRYLCLWCVTPAEGPGGETTLADGRPWLDNLPDAERALLEELKLSWKTTDAAESLGVQVNPGLDPVLHEGDMPSFVEQHRYSAVIVPTGSITLLTGRQALVDALRCFRECSVAGGRLIVDVPAPQLLVEPEAMRSWSSGSGSGRCRPCTSTTTRRRIRRCVGFAMRNGATAHLRPPSCSAFACSTGASPSSRRCSTNVASASLS